MKLVLGIIACLSLSLTSIASIGDTQGKCLSVDGSHFEITNGIINIYDEIYGESFSGEWQLDRAKPQQFKLRLEGSVYYFSQNAQKKRLFHVFESSSGVNRRFYCPRVDPLVHALNTVNGYW